MNMPKSRDIQAKMPSSKVIYASNESKSVLARNLEECRDNDKNSQSVILSINCNLARNCEGTEQLRELTKKMDNRLSRMNVRRQLFQFLRISNNMMCLYELLRTAVMSKSASPDQCGLRE